MEFGMQKYSMLVTKKGKIAKIVGIELADCNVLKSLQEGESFIHVGIWQADRFLAEEMKIGVSRYYFRQLRKKFTIKVE